MEPFPTPRDDDFGPSAAPRPVEIDHSAETYLRLVANPFLGFFGLIAWLGLVILFLKNTRDLNHPWIPAVVLALVLLLTRMPALFQYHCLDCGATGRLSRWRGHLCPVASERRRQGTPRRLRGPSPPLQVMLWLWVLAAAAAVVVPIVRAP